jgi:DNA polymerase-1
MTQLPLLPPTLFLIDGSSFLYRAFHALRPLHAPDGTAVQAVFGFFRMLKKIVQTHKPTHLAIAWDSKGPTVRHERYSAYKQHRQAPPTDLITQKTIILETIELMGISMLSRAATEADDLLMSAALQATAQGMKVVIVTTDKDLGQVVSDTISIFDPFKETFITPETIQSSYGFAPSQLPFYFALVGDASDNIPGVAGIGPKTAQKLVQTFKSLDALYARIDEVGPSRVRSLLEVDKQNAELSLELFTQHPIEELPAAEQHVFDVAWWERAYAQFAKLAFTSLLPAGYTTQASSPRPAHQAHTITTLEQLQEVCEAIKTVGEVAIDTETDSKHALQAHLVGISLCHTPGAAYYLPLRHVDATATKLSQQLTMEQVRTYLGPVLASAAIKTYMHNAKFDLHVLASEQLFVGNLAFDTMLAADLLVNEDESVGLKALSLRYLHEQMLSFEDLIKAGYKRFDYVPLDLATAYAAADAHQTRALVDKLRNELADDERMTLLQELELPIMHMLCQMEQTGIALDVQRLDLIAQRLSQQLHLLTQEIIALAGPAHAAINLNAPRQLEQLLFHDLQLPPVKKTAGKSGYSTDAEVLEALRDKHPIIPLIMRWREVTKLKNTYADALPGYLDLKTNKIHTNFSQTTAATGRLASSEPNMQNIPMHHDEELSIRSAFYAPAGKSFISADYAHIELRVLAHLSQDENLLSAFAQDLDIHAETAVGLFGISRQAVTPEQRAYAKKINFSILYGLTAFGLSKDLKISVVDAKKLIESYFSHYPGVVAWMHATEELAKTTGYVTTLCGRRRLVPGLHERNKHVYEAARRIAINTVVQGSAAEVVKLGMLACKDTIARAGAEIVLQIHDELLIQVNEENASKLAEDVARRLEQVVSWRVPLKVATRIGKTWHEASK